MRCASVIKTTLSQHLQTRKLPKVGSRQLLSVEYTPGAIAEIQEFIDQYSSVKEINLLRQAEGQRSRGADTSISPAQKAPHLPCCLNE
ncbi:MAG: hypothetical protein PUP92_06105 [Rhizonema sp. PD38]|nr:hypothetical protein [Rhizonema sp. PD38]